VCQRCGLKPEKHSWLLATLLEVFMFICGMLVGVLVN